MVKKAKKVFCESCEWHPGSHVAHCAERCLNKKFATPDYLSPEGCHPVCYKQNDKNDCLGFKQKKI
jgi:hypothetical protein